MIKLIASDLDGTLLQEGTMDINPEIYDIIHKLKAKGIVFAAVSGREYDSIARVFAPVKDDIYFIAGNGGIISFQGEIIEKMAIPADVLKDVVEYVRSQEGASFMTAGSAQAYVERADQAFVKKLREGYKLHVNEVDDVLHAPETMTKVAMYNEKVDAAAGADENMVAPQIIAFCKHGLLSEKQAEDTTAKYKDMLNVKYSSTSQNIGSLSGGNQQKLMLAKLLAMKPKVLFLDEPTRGIDVGAKAEIHQCPATLL